MQPIASTRTWWSSRDPSTVWAALTAVDRYRAWWPWLERFEGDPPSPGAILRATIRAPAGYRVRYTVHFADVVEPTTLSATVAGDLVGSARIDLAPTAGGTSMTFDWHLQPQRLLLRAVGLIAAPVLVRSHDLIIERGTRQFAAGSGVDLVQPENE